MNKPTENDTQLTAPNSAPATIEPKGPGNVSVTALQPSDMQQCQQSLIEWARLKCREVKSDVKELTEAVEHAKSQKWKTSTLARHQMKAQKRLGFYLKVKAALEAGYVIVPNFPVTVFAIRTSKDSPLRLAHEITKTGWSRSNDNEQKADASPGGEGEYRNPLPDVECADEYPKPAERDPSRIVQLFESTDWRDIEFPINMAKLSIMEATTNAMALKIFDELGVLPSPWKKADPVVVARIIRKDGYFRHEITFMVAWHLDTRLL